MAIFTSTSSYSDPLRALNIKALEKRLADVQANAQEAPATMPSPWQGAAHVMGKIGEGLQQGRTEGALSAQRQALSQAMAGVQNGAPTPEQLAIINSADPELGKTYAQQIATARENAATRAAEMERARLASDTTRYNTDVNSQTNIRTTGMQGDVSRDVAATQGTTARDVAATQGTTARDVATAQATSADNVANINARSASGVANIGALSQQQIAEANREAQLKIAQGQTETQTGVAKINAQSQQKIEEMKLDYQKTQGQSDQGKIAADVAAGRLTPEQGDAAMRNKGMDAGMIKFRDEKASEHITTTGRIDDLYEARAMLKQGIMHGILSKTEAEFAANGWYGDKEAGQRTLRFNNIMDMDAVQAMSKALTGQTTDQEMNRFIKDLNNPSLSAQQKLDIVDKMIERGHQYYMSQRDTIKAAGSDPDKVVAPEKQPVPPRPRGMSDAQIMQEAQAAMAANPQAAPAIQRRLGAWGVGG